MPELLDLPDEMILSIFDQVKPHIFLLSSMIGIGNTRLEQLALSKCHTIDLTLNSYHNLSGPVVERFHCYVLPRISNDFQSVTLNLKYLLHIHTIMKHCIHEMMFSLTHLKIILCRFHYKSGKPFEIGKFFFDYLFKRNER